LEAEEKLPKMPESKVLEPMTAWHGSTLKVQFQIDLWQKRLDLFQNLRMYARPPSSALTRGTRSIWKIVFRNRTRHPGQQIKYPRTCICTSSMFDGRAWKQSRSMRLSEQPFGIQTSTLAMSSPAMG
jgi:hypothetical protein